MVTPPDMQHAEEAASNVLDNGFIRVGSVIALVIFMVVASWNVAAWFTVITGKLEAIEASIQALSDDRWRKRDMVRWCRETELKNRELDWACAEIEK